MVCVYASVLFGVMVGGMRKGTLISLLTLPIAVKAAALTLRRFQDPRGIVSALGWNVAVVLGTDFLLAAGFLIG
jgi:1,4-dihydroxy-2-naphthoate octaprenyltransferase